MKFSKLFKIYPIPVLAIVLIITGGVSWIIGNKNISDLLFITCIYAGGIPLLYKVLKDLADKKYNVDIIAIISIFGALLLNEYLAGSIVVLMLSGGEALEKYAESRATQALKFLLEIVPKKAHKVISDNNSDDYEDVSVETLQVTDEILIKQNEIIPVDCLIKSGTSNIDQSNITGESLPVNKTIGDQLLSGTTNLTGILKAIVVRKVEDSSFSQIIKIISNSENNKGKLHRLADRYGAYFTPAVLIFAAVTYFFTKNINFTYSVFVIATPCPLILATPVALISGIGRSAKRGVIVKNGQALENIAQANALVFDKTGTLTEGKPKVVGFEAFNDKHIKHEIIDYAACLNQYSTHILAKSIYDAGDKNNIAKHKVTHVVDIPGKGIKGYVDNEQIVVGSLNYLKSLNIKIPSDVDSLKKKFNDKEYIVSFVVINNLIAGYILLSDELRKDSQDVVTKLRELGFEKIVLASGDTEKVANSIASRVGIKEVYSDTKPEQKADIVRSLIKREFNVAMIGDGVNDTPAMVVANASIAMGARGSTIASETSDIVILVNEIEPVIDVIKISRSTLKIAKQGIYFGMTCSFIGMSFAAAGLLPPVIGAVAQEVIDVIAIFNALRVLRVTV